MGTKREKYLLYEFGRKFGLKARTMKRLNLNKDIPLGSSRFQINRKQNICGGRAKIKVK